MPFRGRAKNWVRDGGRHAIRGFSLLELIVVLSILAALTGLVMPIYRGTFRETRIDRAIADLRATMEFAQGSAVTEAVEFRVYLKPERNVYWVMRLEGIEAGEKVFEPVVDAYGDLTELPPGIRFERPRARRDRDLDNTYYVAFYPSGARDEATVVVSREDARYQKYELSTGGKLTQVTVDAPRGR